MPGHDATAHVATGHPPGHSDKGHGRDLPCAFSGLAAPVLATTDPIQLVLLIAFVMAAGIAWGTPLRRPAVPRSRPPSRGPQRFPDRQPRRRFLKRVPDSRARNTPGTGRKPCSMSVTHPPRPTGSRRAAFHRTIWRWHFWAGLLVAPILLMLSLTGAIYLFNDELNDAIYPGLRFVPPHRDTVPMSRMIQSALAAYPGSASRIDMPGSADRAVVVFVQPDTGPPRRVAVDPGTGRVLGSVVYDRTLIGWADAMHRSILMGVFGERLVELAVCWALVLLVSGLLLWWPRGRFRAAGTLWPRMSGRGRRFWRDLHGPVGLWSAMLIAFLIVTGLPGPGSAGRCCKGPATRWGSAIRRLSASTTSPTASR
ncbi:PepSY domain-containing protein [Sphingomonas sp. I4]